MLIEKAAKLESYLRPIIVHNFPDLSIRLYSTSRKTFIERLVNSVIPNKIESNRFIKKKIWDIEFSNNLFNAAGMFKNGLGYQLVYNQGAGAFLAGTTTYLPRKGNYKNGVLHPFVPLPKSNAAINWMGLPNNGHSNIAKILSNIDKREGCPIGISISADPDIDDLQSLNNLVEGFKIYNKANVDFIELNESCPNVAHHQSNNHDSIDQSLINRLEYISQKFLSKRNRNLPVVVKFSVETDLNQIPTLIKILNDLNYDGINFGNTAKNYNNYLNQIDVGELKAYNMFTHTFGGGISGRPLNQLSLNCCKLATETISTINSKSQFAVIRTGGIQTCDDILESEKYKIDLNQWFTGYFEQFAVYGHNLYKGIIDNG